MVGKCCWQEKTSLWPNKGVSFLSVYIHFLGTVGKHLFSPAGPLLQDCCIFVCRSVWDREITSGNLSIFGKKYLIAWGSHFPRICFAMFSAFEFRTGRLGGHCIALYITHHPTFRWLFFKLSYESCSFCLYGRNFSFNIQDVRKKTNIERRYA